MKPHIALTGMFTTRPAPRIWLCRDKRGWGIGATARDAYDMWKRNTC